MAMGQCRTYRSTEITDIQIKARVEGQLRHAGIDPGGGFTKGRSPPVAGGGGGGGRGGGKGQPGGGNKHGKASTHTPEQV